MSEYPRRRRPARRQVLRDPAVVPITYHFPAQGTRRAQEAQFREHLRQFCQAWEEVLDPLVWEALMEHLYRTDSDGNILCFAGPLRRALFQEVGMWLTAQAAGLQAAMLPAWEALEALGSTTHDATWNELPDIVCMQGGRMIERPSFKKPEAEPAARTPPRQAPHAPRRGRRPTQPEAAQPDLFTEWRQ